MFTRYHHLSPPPHPHLPFKNSTDTSVDASVCVFAASRLCPTRYHQQEHGCSSCSHWGIPNTLRGWWLCQLTREVCGAPQVHRLPANYHRTCCISGTVCTHYHSGCGYHGYGCGVQNSDPQYTHAMPYISHPFIWQMCFADIILPIYGLDYIVRMLTSVRGYIPLYPRIYLTTGTSKTVEKWVRYVQNSILTISHPFLHRLGRSLDRWKALKKGYQIPYL